MIKNIIIGLFSLAALGAGGYLGITQFSQKTESQASHLWQLELPDIDKKLRNGKEWDGKVVIVNHWATWCAPCREEIPMLIEFNQAMLPQGAQVIGVAHDLIDASRIFGDEIGIDYPSLVAIVGGRELLAAHGNVNSGALPYTAIFNRKGELVDAKLGKVSYRELQDMVTPYL